MAGKGWGELQIRRVGGGDFTDFPAPASGSTDNGKAWAWNSATQSFEPRTFLLASAAGAFGLTMLATADAAGGRTALELGTAAVLNVGTSANNVVQLDGSAKLPAVDGSALTNLPGGTAAGSTTQVIFNDAGAYAGDAGLTYAKATDRLTVVGGLIAPSMRPASDSTTALQLMNAAGTAFVTGDTTNGRLGIGTSTPSAPLHIVSAGFTSARFKRSTVGGGSGFTLENGDAASVNFGNAAGAVASFFAGIEGSGQPTFFQATTNSFIFPQSGVLTWATGDTGGLVAGDTNLYRHAANTLRTNDALVVDVTVAIGQTSATALLDLAASTTARASLRIREATQVPSSPNSGDFWFPASGRLTFRRSTTTEIVATGVTGSGASATAGGTYGATEQAMLQTVYDIARTFGMLN